MARLVKRTATGPAAYMIGGEEQWLCRCGLSGNQPYCDGSHNLAAGEDPAGLCWYDEDGERHEVHGEFPGIRTY